MSISDQNKDQNNQNKRWEDFQKIDRSRNIFRQIFEYSVIPTLVHDMDMQIIEVNQQAIEQFGYPKQEFLQKTIYDLHTPEEIEHSNKIRQKLEKEDQLSVETSFKRKDGSIFYAEVTPCKYLVGKRPVIHVFIKDITERKEYEIRLNHYNSALKKQIIKTEKRARELQIKNEELEQFAFIASHDLQEPLRTITNYVSLLERKYQGKLDSKADNFIKFISKAAFRMSSLIEGLLKYGQIGQKSELREVDCNIVLSDTLEDISKTIKKSEATIEASELPTIKAYPIELQSLFQNLINNSIKYQEKDSKPVIKISAFKEEDSWMFKFQDNGIGIDKKYHEQIFTIYQRLHNQRDYEGTGIGLAHCRKIVELHGGEIWVDSEPNKGSVFHVKLPIYE